MVALGSRAAGSLRAGALDEIVSLLRRRDLQTELLQHACVVLYNLAGDTDNSAIIGREGP